MAETQSLIGRTLGHYRIVEKIGAGGMGEVFRAHDEELDRDVALKFLPAGALIDETARKRFRKEALTLAKLNHPNVATIHEFVTQDGISFLVMEYVAGNPLSRELTREAMPEKQVLALASQIAQALQEAHERGVIHRDLKPGNIVITPKGLAKILDFGLAEHLRPVSEKTTIDSLNEARVVAGTLPYMAPEQLLGEATDARTDIYGFGALLYEMATGQRPFRDEVSARLTDAILHQMPAAPRSLSERVSPELERIILKCLEKDPENRYQSAKELDVDLRRMQMGSSASAVRAEAPPRAGGRRRVAALVAVAIAVAVAIGAGVNYWRGAHPGGSGAPQIQSLAVLPLENLSGDPEQEYFAEGMTEELITQLAQISALRVISRTSVMPYLGTRKPLAEIASELRVDAVVEGSVMRSGNRVRITAKLIQASTDKNLWAKGYDRDLNDVLSLQSEVARDIAQEVRVRLTPQEQRRLEGAPQINPQAHDAYLKGRYHWDKETEDDFVEAKKYFEQAIALDANYAAAYSGLADYYWATDVVAPRVAMPKAREYAQKALALDDSISAAHTALAAVKFYADWDWPGAEQEFKRAVELNPSDAEAHRLYSAFLSAMGRADDALVEIRAAQDLDPVSIFSGSSAGWTYYFARQYDQAIEQCQRTVELESNNVGAHACLGYAALAKGKFDEAVEECKKAAELSHHDPVRVAGLARAYALAGKIAEARQLLENLQGESRRHFVPPTSLAAVYAALGEKNAAIAMLEKAYEQRDSYITWLKVDDAFDSLRSEPRFQALLRRIGLPP
ncbi:MAG TPA: protein kinase [Candidatus Bathyarchaeia archaeon]|nr:protein kinase [Candidatus Bathyarchaeia archaeon]